MQTRFVVSQSLASRPGLYVVGKTASENSSFTCGVNSQTTHVLAAPCYEGGWVKVQASLGNLHVTVLHVQFTPIRSSKPPVNTIIDEL